jgi:cysteine desulfurase
MIHILYEPTGSSAMACEGEILMGSLHALGASIEAACRGNAACSTCAVRIVEGKEHLLEMETPELDRLKIDGYDPALGFRLSCQVRFREGSGAVRVASPPVRLNASEREHRKRAFRRIYLDHTRGTFMSENVLKAMLPYQTGRYPCASGKGFFAGRSREVVVKAVGSISSFLGCQADRVALVRGGEEANFLAVLAAARLKGREGKRRVAAGTFEGRGVCRALRVLEGEGFVVDRLAPGEGTVFTPQGVEANLREDTGLVALAHADPHVGIVQPMEGVAQLLQSKGIWYHCDATQTVGRVPFDWTRSVPDSLAFGAAAVYGPPGSGGVRWAGSDPFPWEDIPEGEGALEEPALAAGLAAAFEETLSQVPRETSRLAVLRDQMAKLLVEKVPGLRILDDEARMTLRMPNTLCCTFPSFDARGIGRFLEWEGIHCAVEEEGASECLLALGCSLQEARCAITFSLGRENTEREMLLAAERFANAFTNKRALTQDPTVELHSVRHGGAS